MSQGATPNIDDLSPASEPENDEVPELNLNPGESFVGNLLSIDHELGEYDSTLAIFLDPQLGEKRKMWLPGHVEAQFYSADIEEGDVVGLIKEEELTKVDTDDDETVEYNRIEVRTE